MASKRAAILGTDSLAVSNRPCAASNVKAMQRADWKAVDAAMIQAASICAGRGELSSCEAVRGPACRRD